MKYKKEGVLTPEEQVIKIQEACSELEWYIAMNDSENGVKGLVIGNQEFVTKIVEQLGDAEDYQVWGRPTTGNSELH